MDLSLILKGILSALLYNHSTTLFQLYKVYSNVKYQNKLFETQFTFEIIKMSLQKEITEFLLKRLQNERNNDDLNKLSNYLEMEINNLTLNDSMMEFIQSIKDNHGRTPLHYVAKWGLGFSCENLIYQARLELTEDSNGLTPLHYAARYGHYHSVEVILKRINEKNDGFEGEFLFSI